MDLTINMTDGNHHHFVGRDGDEVFRKIETADGQFVKFRREKYKCQINREYIVSIEAWED